MTTAELYTLFTNDGKLSAAARTLSLSPDYLASLASRGVSATDVIAAVCCYFPARTVEIAELDPVSPPRGNVIELTGRCLTTPFDGLRVSVWLATQGTDLRMSLSAYGAAVDTAWTLEQGFPFYKG